MLNMYAFTNSVLTIFFITPYRKYTIDLLKGKLRSSDVTRVGYAADAIISLYNFLGRLTPSLSLDRPFLHRPLRRIIHNSFTQIYKAGYLKLRLVSLRLVAKSRIYTMKIVF